MTKKIYIFVSKLFILLIFTFTGVLNKLAGTNLHWASTTIENLYSNNSRNSVNTALTDLWMEAAVSSATTPQRMLVEHAALISILHANIGSEIGNYTHRCQLKFNNH